MWSSFEFFDRAVQKGGPLGCAEGMKTHQCIFEKKPKRFNPLPQKWRMPRTLYDQ